MVIGGDTWRCLLSTTITTLLSISILRLCCHCYYYYYYCCYSLLCIWLWRRQIKFWKVTVLVKDLKHRSLTLLIPLLFTIVFNTTKHLLNLHIPLTPNKQTKNRLIIANLINCQIVIFLQRQALRKCIKKSYEFVSLNFLRHKFVEFSSNLNKTSFFSYNNNKLINFVDGSCKFLFVLRIRKVLTIDQKSLLIKKNLQNKRWYVNKLIDAKIKHRKFACMCVSQLNVSRKTNLYYICYYYENRCF